MVPVESTAAQPGVPEEQAVQEAASTDQHHRQDFPDAACPRQEAASVRRTTEELVDLPVVEPAVSEVQSRYPSA